MDRRTDKLIFTIASLLKMTKNINYVRIVFFIKKLYQENNALFLYYKLYFISISKEFQGESNNQFCNKIRIELI